MIKKVISLFREKNILSLTTSMLVALIGLLNFMLLTRSLDKAMFGEWVLFITISTFVDMLRFGLTSNALIRFASNEDPAIREKYLGASYKIGLLVVAVCCIVLWFILGLVYLFNLNIDGGYRLFLIYYPLLALFNLSWNNSVSYFQALQKFDRVLYIRLLTTLPFLLLLFINYSLIKADISTILLVYLGCNMIPSLMIFYRKWDGLMHMKSADKESTKEMLRFGKFSMGTLVGTYLLKCADTIIIGLSPILGSVGIALYAIPLKLTDLLSIPLRSFSIAAYPRMS
ncbi:MAG: oligosaccharide flippase family protein, partial [Bacteroidales bacterium]